MMDEPWEEQTSPANHSKWKVALIIFHLPVYLLVLIFNGLGIEGAAIVPDLYHSSTANLSAKYVTPMTPAGWTFGIWGFIYAWQLVHIIYSLSLICRKSRDGTFYYLSSAHMHFSFYIIFMLNNGLNIAWLFIFDREQEFLAFLFLCFIAVTLYICTIIVCVYLDKAGNYLESSGSSKDIWMTRIFVLNGVAFYGTWATIASMLNFGVVLQYTANVSATNSTWTVLAVFSVEVIAWFLMETFLFDRYLRYCFSPYIVLIVAFAGILSKNYDSTNPKPYYVYVIALLAASAVLFVVKMVVMVVRGKRNPIKYNRI